MTKKKKKKPVGGLKANKATPPKKLTSKSATSKKSLKAKKTAKKTTTKKKAQQVLSNKRWKSTRTATGKVKKGRKRSTKLKRQTEQNRYQTIVKAISEYYKKAGSPLKRADLYAEYRKIRDDYSNIPLAMLLPQFSKLVVRRVGKRIFPNELQLGIPWYQFEDEMTAPYAQRYFLSKDTITLDLSCLVPYVPDMTFPYIKVIGNYRNLYNNQTFRTQVKGESPVPEFLIDWSRSDMKKGEYVFVLVECPPVVGVTPPPKPSGQVIYTTPTEGTLPTISTATIDSMIQDKLEDKKDIRDAYRNKDISFQDYQKKIDKLDKEINNLKSQ